MANVIKDRDGKILEAAIKLAETEGYQWITRKAVAAAAGVASGTINNAYGDMRGLKRAVLTAAVERCHYGIIAQGLADRHPIVMAAPSEVRSATAMQMAG
jgi:AcrR family transcriptional regulator